MAEKSLLVRGHLNKIFIKEVQKKLSAMKKIGLLDVQEAWFDVVSKILWDHAEIAYREPNGSESLFKDAVHFYHIRTALDYCYCVEYEDGAILSFRGTDTEDKFDTNLIKRWIRNITVYPLVVDGGTIHRGFYEAWKSLKVSVRSMISAIPENKNIYIIGHSLGADLAYLAARDLVKNCKMNPDRLNCMVFAPAGLFTMDGIIEYDSLKILTSHVVNGYDIVDCIPAELVRPGERTWLYQPLYHKVFYRVRDHLPKSYRKAIHNYITVK